MGTQDNSFAGPKLTSIMSSVSHNELLKAGATVTVLSFSINPCGGIGVRL